MHGSGERTELMAEYIIAALPNWIQALDAICLVILTLLTLIILRGYAADTKTIADTSVSQTENSQMPFLAVAMREGDGNAQGGWTVENQGFGPALNIGFSDYREGRRHMRPISSQGMSFCRGFLASRLASRWAAPAACEVTGETPRHPPFSAS
jgi:hypothetical protein